MSRHRTHFGAPWGPKVWGMTLLATGLLAYGIVTSEAAWIQLLLLALLLGTYAYGVRGYSVENGQVLVHRLGWATRFDLDGLRGVEVAPDVTIGSVRTFGNGGLFGFVGHFRNASLGSYRAYATKDENAVVLHLADETVVVTPGQPAAFVDAVQKERRDRE